MSSAGPSSVGAPRAPNGRTKGQTSESKVSDTDSAAMPRPDQSVDPRIPAGLLGPGIESHVLIMEGGKGGAGGPGGIHASGDGGSGGTGEGAKVYITAQNVTNMHPSPAVIQASQILNHCPPPSRNFQGRQRILKAMHQFFAENTGKQHIYMLYGLGGAGKTQIALKFIDDSTSFTDKFFVDMSSTETIETGLRAIAVAKGIGNSSQDALKWLATRDEQWLLFFDNADDPKVNPNRFFPKCNHGNIIITTRNPSLRSYGAHSQISDMEESDAIALLLKSAMEENSIPNELLAADIVKVLWYLPLPIVQAGAFILESGSLDTYLALYSKNQAKLLSEKPTLSHDDYAWAAYTTWQMSFDRLSPPAAKFVQLCSFLHQDGISEDIFSRAAYSLVQDQSEDKPKKLQKLKAKFRRLWSRSEISLKNNAENPRKFLSWFLRPNGEWDSASFVKVTKEIMAYSLVNFDAERKSFSIHPLVHEWSRTTLADQDLSGLCMSEILGMSIMEIPEVDMQLASLSLISHVDALLTHGIPKMANDYGLEYADVFHYTGRSQEAARLEASTLEKWRKLLGDDHRDTLRAMNNLASTYRNLGRFQEAEKLQLVVLEKLRKLLGDDHLDTLLGMNNLAITYHNLGQFQEAEKLQLVVLEKRRKLLGDDHLDTLIAMNNLANTSHYWPISRSRKAATCGSGEAEKASG
ncbi:P-loop containing nucleoside triphosphate hydrolase protein [Mycena galopus ATCC 62051]|nr:P-loop containing nucleoside triphosphate hydrolase protein [Mycena galopus ATCC 62051]